MLEIKKFKRVKGIKKRTNPVYRAWAGMLRRCYNVKCKDYKAYGGNGILVESGWKHFEIFYYDMAGSFKPGLTLERRDNTKSYSLSNCYWADRKIQAINRSSSNMITNPETGETLTVSDLARKYGISRGTINSRIRLGYTDFFILIGKKHSMRNGRAK